MGNGDFGIRQDDAFLIVYNRTPFGCRPNCVFRDLASIPHSPFRIPHLLPIPHSHLEILYEDNHLLAIAKPVELPTMGVPDDCPSLLALAKEYIRQRYHKPGNVYLGAMSRLDVPVSGVVLFARTSKAASRLTDQFRTREVEKTYWALVAGSAPLAADCIDWMVKDERHRRMHLATAGQPGAQEARLHYRRRAQLPRATLLEIALETGASIKSDCSCRAADSQFWGIANMAAAMPFPLVSPCIRGVYNSCIPRKGTQSNWSPRCRLPGGVTASTNRPPNFCRDGRDGFLAQRLGATAQQVLSLELLEMREGGACACAGRTDACPSGAVLPGA